MTVFAIWQGVLVNLNYASVYASPVDVESGGFNFNANSVVVTTQGRLLAWGDNNSKQLTDFVTTPFARSSVDITEAFSLQANEGITLAKVVPGGYNSFGNLVVLTSLGRVFTTGANNAGQLGIGRTSAFEPTAQDITASFNLNEGESIEDFLVGVEVIFAKTNMNRYFAWGVSSAPADRIPGFSQNVLSPTLLDFKTLGNFEVDEEVAYFNFKSMNGFIITNRNRLFAWGTGAWGQIPGLNGLTNQLVDVTSLFQLTNDERFAQVYIGLQHVITIVENTVTGVQKVFSQGRRGSYLGFSETRVDVSPFYDNIPFNITSLFGLAEEESIVNVYVEGSYTYALLNTNELVKITKTDGSVEARIQILIAIGDNHIGGIKKMVMGESEQFLLLTHDGAVYTWGTNMGYALGTNITNQSTTTTSPRMINGFLTTPVFLSTVQVRFGDVIPLITPTMANFVFNGWYEDALLNTPYLEKTMPATEVTLYASWVLGVS
jgi:uncharacterized repeat protein (TIGR02543 family)